MYTLFEILNSVKAGLMLYSILLNPHFNTIKNVLIKKVKHSVFGTYYKKIMNLMGIRMF